MLAKRETNVYTIEKNGRKKLIYETPWFEKGEFRGIVELALPIPFEVPHFVRSRGVAFRGNERPVNRV